MNIQLPQTRQLRTLRTIPVHTARTQTGDQTGRVGSVAAGDIGLACAGAGDEFVGGAVPAGGVDVVEGAAHGFCFGCWIDCVGVGLFWFRVWWRTVAGGKLTRACWWIGWCFFGLWFVVYCWGYDYRKRAWKRIHIHVFSGRLGSCLVSVGSERPADVAGEGTGIMSCNGRCCEYMYAMHISKQASIAVTDDF